MPILASSRRGPSSERSAMNSDTVKPIPATVEAPTSCGKGTVSGSPPRRGRVASQETPLMPINLPTTSPATTPMVIGEPIAERSRSPRSTTPTLASANSGTIT